VVDIAEVWNAPLILITTTQIWNYPNKQKNSVGNVLETTGNYPGCGGAVKPYRCDKTDDFKYHLNHICSVYNDTLYLINPTGYVM
jgi:hypothetical protein